MYEPSGNDINFRGKLIDKGVDFYDFMPTQSGTYFLKLYNYFDNSNHIIEHPYTVCVKEIKPYTEKDSDSVVISAEDGSNIYVNVSMTSMVMFNGKKHVVSSGKNNKTYANDIAITIDDGSLSQFEKAKNT